ncbi:MAG: hypothetical protein A3K46_05580 [Chloroflexi bacterium RBG_13_60_9]|nr:MAG: hypothetical protein A3K46_05580 [Chloroflexi bacterium RBG_13_60_9]
MESRMPRDLVPTSVITQNYRVNGMVSVTAAGLIGLLSDPTDSYIEVENASLVRLHRPQEVVAQFNTWGMVKSRVIAVLCEKTADLGRITIARAGFTRLISYRVWASLHGFEMFGILESPGKFDFSSQMFQGNSQFTALFNATLIPVYFPQLVTRAPAILFNRQMVEGIGVISEVEEEVAAEEKGLGRTGQLGRLGTGQLGRTGTGQLSQGGTGQFPRTGTGQPGRTGNTQPRPTGTTGQFPRSGPRLDEPDEEIK